MCGVATRDLRQGAFGGSSVESFVGGDVAGECRGERSIA